MKILFFNYEYPPLGGGAANATAYILAEFSKIPDLEVDLVTSSIDEKYHLDEISGKIRVHRLPIGKNSTNLHFQSQKDLLVYSWKAYQFSKELIATNKYDLTHSFFSIPCGFLSMLLKRKYDLPYIVSLRGSDVPGYSERFDLAYYVFTPIIKYVWKKSDAVISNSVGLKELALKAKANQEVGIIFNGIDIDNFKPDPSKKSTDKFIITPGASRVTKRKGLDFLIKAVAQLLPKYPNIFLKVLGDGDEKENLMTMVSEMKLENSVQFVGRVPRDETAPYYQEASLFVLPSFNEGMSNAMLEALAAGLPIVATKTGGTDELVTEGQNGLVIEMGNVEDLAEKIEAIISNPELCAKMGQASRKVAETMSWGQVAQQYFELYGKIKKLKD
ncbi:MAG: Glycosyl transferase group 1 [Candidatus Moranbacteria bacterium GW2011_GWA2_39_41]|nr:MAG: Glycosyl transferase group 1 [Candidatus Moranbacteria bacterium GW2011_GWA2_39_41]